MTKKKPANPPSTNAGTVRGKRLIEGLTTLRDRLKRGDFQKSPPIASWVCPKCGTAHPVTVTECCRPDNTPFVTHVWRLSPVSTDRDDCLHRNCQGCRNGTCNGIHMISCPCPRCSPRC